MRAEVSELEADERQYEHADGLGVGALERRLAALHAAGEQLAHTLLVARLEDEYGLAGRVDEARAARSPDHLLVRAARDELAAHIR